MKGKQIQSKGMNIIETVDGTTTEYQGMGATGVFTFDGVPTVIDKSSLSWTAEAKEEFPAKADPIPPVFLDCNKIMPTKSKATITNIKITT